MVASDARMLHPLWLHQTQASCGKSNEKAQRRGQMPILAGRHADPFSMVGKPLPTSFRDRENIKVVSERLGHASVTVTLSVYAHVLPGDQRQAAARFAALVAGADA
jgi:alkanesulfonate monooxygenase SsuD/methylene tetrahydromethanopterin reductase-like flavin-dependent oxidoreductase (luciferase family)